MVSDVLMPIIGIITGKVNFAELSYTIVEKTASSEGFYLKYGAFLQSIIDFIIIAFCIFILIKLVNKFKQKEEKKEEVKGPSPEESLLIEIRDILKDSHNKKV
jgi:large conductance mechanosensitive channel